MRLSTPAGNVVSARTATPETLIVTEPSEAAPLKKEWMPGSGRELSRDGRGERYALARSRGTRRRDERGRGDVEWIDRFDERRRGRGHERGVARIRGGDAVHACGEKRFNLEDGRAAGGDVRRSQIQCAVVGLHCAVGPAGESGG